jgi:lactate permease
MPWIQTYAPVGESLGRSALVAAIPLVIIFICLALLKMKAHKAAPLAVASAFLIAITVWGMPAKLAGLAFMQGAAFGLFPIFYIVITTLFLYNITVKGGQFEVIRASLAGVTGDRRIQVLLIAFCFGAFIEGAAGFGTPVAIAGATLVGLGFRPLYAAGVCLIANTTPVAFGAIGIPVVAMSGVMGFGDDGMMKLSTMIGRQLPFISVIIPFYVIIVMVGWKKTIEVLPAVLVCGGTFAVSQWATASYLGPYLPDIIASLTSLVALVALLQVWQPKANYVFDHETHTGTKEQHHYTLAEVFRAWAPYLALTMMVLLWGIPSIKAKLDRSKVVITVTGLDRMIVKKVSVPGRILAQNSAGIQTLAKAPADQPPVNLPAKYNLNFMSAAGTAILIAAFLSIRICGVSFGDAWKLAGKTLYDMRFPAVTVASVLGLADVMNTAGMTNCLGLVFTKTGHWFPFISPFLGWLGVFLTGSDTSSNVLFGGLQQATAEQLGINPILTCAANTSGGVMGKMISPQSLAVATAACGMVGQEGTLFRFTFKHSIFLTFLIGVIVYVQAYYMTWMIP